MTEQWKTIPGFSGSYEANDMGRIRSLRRIYTDAQGVKRTVRGQILKPKHKADGHTQVDLLGSMKSVHSLVMLAFIGPRPRAKVIMHLNHVADDNRLLNLQYGSQSQNVKMDFQRGTRSALGIRNARARLCDAYVSSIRQSPLTNAELAKIYEVSKNAIHDARSRKTWTHVL